jgi:hypothetical protein
LDHEILGRAKIGGAGSIAPTLRKKREEWAPSFMGRACETKSLGHPPFFTCTSNCDKLNSGAIRIGIDDGIYTFYKAFYRYDCYGSFANPTANCSQSFVGYGLMRIGTITDEQKLDPMNDPIDYFKWAWKNRDTSKLSFWDREKLDLCAQVASASLTAGWVGAPAAVVTGFVAPPVGVAVAGSSAGVYKVAGVASKHLGCGF